MHLPQKQGIPRGRTPKRKQVSRHFRTVSFQVASISKHIDITTEKLELKISSEEVAHIALFPRLKYIILLKSSSYKI